jgi:hypothetical protein
MVQKKDGSVVGTVTPKYRYKDLKATILGEFTTQRDIKGEVSFDDAVVDGLKSTLTAQYQVLRNALTSI